MFQHHPAPICRTSAPVWRSLLVAAMLIGLAACSPGASKKAADPSGAVSVVRIAAIASTLAGKPIYTGVNDVIISEGWLAKTLAAKGVRLEWQPVSGAVGGPVINEGFANGSLDFAGYGDLPTVIANANGISTQLVVPTNSGNTVYVLVGAKSAAKSLEDLKGKRIALNRARPWEAVFARLIQSRGLKFTDFQIVNISSSAGATALASGKVDALVALGVDAYPLEDKGLTRAIWSSKSGPADWAMRAELFGRTAFLKAHPDIAQDIATAYIKADYWASQPQNRDAYLKLQTRTGMPLPEVEQDYDDGRPWKDHFSPLPSPTLAAHYDGVASYARQAGLIHGPVDVQRLVHTDFVQRALVELGLQTYWSPPATGPKGPAQ